MKKQAQPLAMKTNPELSLVIPVYNEEKRIAKGLREILEFMKTQPYVWELIVVDDGSLDSTRNIAGKMLKDVKNGRIISSIHTGKGGAIKQGVMNAKGEWVIFLDIDLATPMAELPTFMDARSEYDILIGSRKMEGANVTVHQPKFREFGGKVFTWLTNRIATKGVSDITCGFKLFRTNLAKQLFRKSRLSDWSFDAEILFLAQKTGARIKEMPVVWKDDPNTKVSLVRDTLNAFTGLLKIRFNDLMGKYQ